MMKETQLQTSKLVKEAGVLGVFFDGRKDETKVITKGADGRFHQDVKKEEHY